ncbi:MAG TPA: methyltransferase domain-containing protein [Gemmatimonadaceae bacterium]
MTATITPTRHRGVEALEVPGVPDKLMHRSLDDVARANALFGGTRAVMRELRDVFEERAGDRLTLLDIGTGAADIPLAARALARRLGVTLTTYGLDAAVCLARAAGERLDGAVAGDALALPIADRSVDIVICSQLLHHFRDPDIATVLRELHRVARLRVVVSDLRRSWLAAAGIWLASFPLGFHPVSRHDGVLSVLRGFTGNELGSHVIHAIGRAPTVRQRLGWRVTAAWAPVP